MPATKCTCIRSRGLTVLISDPDCPAYTIHVYTELKENAA
jgi:hypothetical protein